MMPGNSQQSTVDSQEGLGGTNDYRLTTNLFLLLFKLGEGGCEHFPFCHCEQSEAIPSPLKGED